MTSSDMQTLTLLLEKHFAVTEKQLSDMRKDNTVFREQMKDDFNSFKNEIRNEFNSFKTEVRNDINSFKAETNSRFDKIEAQIHDIQIDVTGLKHDVAGLYHWDYWLLSIILVVFAMPQIVAGVKALFSAVHDGIAGILALFKNDEHNSK